MAATSGGRHRVAAWKGARMTGLYHGTWWEQHKKDSFTDLQPGRFTQLLPKLDPAKFNLPDLARLARKMTSRQERNPAAAGERHPEDASIPTAYTYLGQFADHDLTFDPTSQLRQFLSPSQINGLQDYRTPRFDLDNLYGRGPADQPYMYEQGGIHMLLGGRMSGNPFDRDARQIPRGPNGPPLIRTPPH